MIYVDDPMPMINGRFKNYCHIWTDGSHMELNGFALRLGLRLAWARKKGGILKDFYHFDISPLMRERALKMGAEYIPLAEYVKRVKP